MPSLCVYLEILYITPLWEKCWFIYIAWVFFGESARHIYLLYFLNNLKCCFDLRRLHPVFSRWSGVDEKHIGFIGCLAYIFTIECWTTYPRIFLLMFVELRSLLIEMFLIFFCVLNCNKTDSFKLYYLTLLLGLGVINLVLQSLPWPL